MSSAKYGRHLAELIKLPPAERPAVAPLGVAAGKFWRIKKLRCSVCIPDSLSSHLEVLKYVVRILVDRVYDSCASLYLLESCSLVFNVAFVRVCAPAFNERKRSRSSAVVWHQVHTTSGLLARG